MAVALAGGSYYGPRPCVSYDGDIIEDEYAMTMDYNDDEEGDEQHYGATSSHMYFHSSSSSKSDLVVKSSNRSGSLVDKPRRKRKPAPYRLLPRPVHILKHDLRRQYMQMFVNTVNSNDIHMLLSFLSTFAVPDLVMTGKVDLKRLLPKNHLPTEEEMEKLRAAANAQQQHNSPRPRQSGPLSLATMTYDWNTKGRSLIAAFYGCSQLLKPDQVMRIENTKIKTFSNTTACELSADIIMDITHIFDLPDHKMLEEKLDNLYNNNTKERFDHNPYAKALDADKYESRFRQSSDSDSNGESSIGGSDRAVESSVKKKLKQELQVLHQKQQQETFINQLSNGMYSEDPFEAFYHRFVLEGKPVKKAANPLSLSIRMSYTLKIDEQQRLHEISFFG